MSRIGRKPIQIPKGIEVAIDGGRIKTKGPKGELSLDIPQEIKIEIDGENVVVSEKRKTKKSRALWGTIRSLVYNAIEGVNTGYTKELQIKGVGYRAEMKNDKLLVLQVGFSHPVEIEAPEGIQLETKKDIIIVSGSKKDLVGRVAAEIRGVRPPDAYKGKGIRYKDEEIILKEGKKGAGS